MALRQARQVKNLTEAINKDLPIVLLSPNNGQSSLSFTFDKSSENAKMTTLSQWVKPPRQNGKVYGHIETKDWDDFESKLNTIIKNNKTSKLKIEFDGYITNFNNTVLNQENKPSLIKSLKDDEGGTALYSDSQTKISFLKLEFDKHRNLSVSLPYITAQEGNLKQIYLHSPDNHTTSDYHDQFDHINLA
ncbi:MAG: hypothetical protein ACRBDI_05755 [Alphaproteobacteria bacterium]